MTSPIESRAITDALGADTPFHFALAAVEPDAIRERCSGVVTSLVTYERATSTPAAGGLFDEAIFGAGASLELPGLGEEDVVRDVRATRFARIELGPGVPHPMLAPRTLMDLPVLPALLRPLVRVEAGFAMSDVNMLYQQVLRHALRRHRLAELSAPAELLAESEAALTQSLSALMDNERIAAPTRANGRVLGSLRSLLRPEPRPALAALDLAVGAGLDLRAALPLWAHRTVAALFALGIAVVPSPPRDAN